LTSARRASTDWQSVTLIVMELLEGETLQERLARPLIRRR
jgi:hypothetical protein